MAVFLVDVTFSASRPTASTTDPVAFRPNPAGDDWRRYAVDARDDVEASLIAAQMCASHGWQ